MARFFILAMVLGLMAVPAGAGTIRNACLSAERGASHLCGCIQAAADRTLTQREQRMAARLFRDPDRAQQIRMSERRSDEVFWDHYKAFSETAQAFCG